MPLLLLATVALWIGGIVLLIIAWRMKPKGLEGAEPPTWDWILRSIFGGIVAAIGKITKPSGTWELVEGIGALAMWAGALTLVGYVLVDVVKLIPTQPGTTSPSPSPSPSASAG